MNLVWVIVIMVTTMANAPHAPHECLTTLTATSSLQEVDAEIHSVGKYMMANDLPPELLPAAMTQIRVMTHEQALKNNLKMLQVRRVVEHSRVISEDDQKERVAEIDTIIGELKGY